MKFNLAKTPRAIKAASEKNAQLKIILMDENESEGKPELLIMDQIGADFWGDGVSAVEVIEFLGKHKGKAVNARINTFGGDAYEGLVMHNAFQNHEGEVTAIVEGIAFSAGSILAMGADKVVMQSASDFGIHYANTGAWGNATVLAGAIEWLNAVDEHQINIFSAKTGESRETVQAWLKGTDDGTIFNAQAALDAGFADEVVPLRSGTPKETTAKTEFKPNLYAAQLKHRHIMAGRR